MSTKNVALRKRTQIARANQTMFIWVAGVSVVFGIALVATVFLAKMLFFNEKVIAEKNNTVRILKQNNNNVDALISSVRALDANQSLVDVNKNVGYSHAIQVILDALPSDANSLALGASIQNKLLNGIDGLKVNSLQTDPVVGIESLSNNTSTINMSSASSGSDNEITFRFSVSGSETALKQVLNNLEKSIRTIDVTSLKIEGQGNGVSTMSIQGRAFYEPAKTVDLSNKVIKS
ncbi:hypothetical protein HGB24_00775 [Candidatus Saccharibacteria bacterium]|nr:hypothetical protein [Candidatus Saccharibacteria bacterium]